MSGTDFAEIYRKWEDSHDEESAIEKRITLSEKQTKHIPTINELRRMKVQDELDLHNYLLEDAVKASRDFISQSIKRGLKKIRIVTGKGLHSPNGEAVIRPAVISVVKASKQIREYDLNPRPEDGGSGAMIIILK